MKIEINIETNDRDQEYTMWPYGEREAPPESTLKINVKNNPSDDDINQEVERRIKLKEIDWIDVEGVKIK